MNHASGNAPFAFMAPHSRTDPSRSPGLSLRFRGAWGRDSRDNGAAAGSVSAARPAFFGAIVGMTVAGMRGRCGFPRVHGPFGLFQRARLCLAAMEVGAKLGRQPRLAIIIGHGRAINRHASG